MKIEDNKITKPFMEFARKKALGSHKEIIDKVNKAIEKEISRKEIDRLFEKYYDVCKYLHDSAYEKKYGKTDPYYRLSEQEKTYGDYKLFSLLTTDKKIGVPIFKRAYMEYYNLDTKCAYCGKRFTSKNRGRKAKYDSDSCRYMAYRKRKKEKENGKKGEK